MDLHSLPTVNASLNGLSALLLLAGFVAIKKKRQDLHKKIMVSALLSSAAFLTFYLFYHFKVGSIPYPHHDWTRPLYFTILIPHVTLAAVMLPFIFIAVRHTLKGRYQQHKKFVHWVWPVWMYVSVTGVIVYFMLYHF